MATFDNLYRKCYNKCNDDNKNVICHQSPKFALYGVFAFMGIKSRRTPKNAVERIYIKYGNTKNLKLYAVQGQREKAYLYIQKRHFVKSLSYGYKIVIILPIAFPLWRWQYKLVRQNRKHDGPNGGGRQKVNRRTPGEAPP